MSDVTKQVTLEVGAKNDTPAGLGQVESSVKKSLGNIEAEAAHSHSRIKATLEDINANFGRSSALKQTFELLRGAGAVAGLSVAGEELNALTEKAKELTTAFALGEKSGGQIADELLRSLPVLGNIYSAGRNIRDIIDGDAVAIAEANEAAKQSITHAENVKALLLDSKTILDAIKNDQREVRISIGDATVAKLHRPLDEIGKQTIHLSADLDVNKDSIDKKLKDLRDEYQAKARAYDESINKPLPTQFLVNEERGPGAGASGYERAMNTTHQQIVNPAYLAARAAQDRAIADKDSESRALEAKLKEIETEADKLIDDIKSKFKAETLVDFDVAKVLFGKDGTSGAIAAFQGVAKRAESVFGNFLSPALRRFEAEISQSTAIDGVKRALQDIQFNPNGNDERQKTLSDIEIDQQRTLAGIYGQSYEIEAKRLEIHQKFVDQEKELLAIAYSNDASTTDDERSKARALLSTIRTREETEKTKALADELRSQFVSAVPNVATGFGSAAKYAANEQFSASQRASLNSIASDGDVAIAVDRSISKASGDSASKIVTAIGELGVLLNKLIAAKPLRTVGQ